MEVTIRVDINPTTIKTVWRDNSDGRGSISKGLDRFLVFDDLLQQVDGCQTWVEVGSLSDHNPI